MKTAIIGSGAWGTVLARILAENGYEAVIWSHSPDIAEQINKEKENRALFPGVKLPEGVRAVTDLEVACRDSQLVVLVIASKFFGDVAGRIGGFLAPDALVVSATKGLNPADNKRLSLVLQDRLPAGCHERIAVLSGPNMAREIAARKPAAAVIASVNEEAATRAQKFFSSPYFRIYTNTDVVGVELGGTLKNIIAIAAGVSDGLELGENTKAALIVRGLVEITRFAVHFGALPDTFRGLTGMGDLVATCSSPLSRNHTVGERLARGQKLPQILESMTAVAEGVETARLIHHLARKEGIVMPVTDQVYAILFEDKPVGQALNDLMTRDLKSEG